MRDPNYNLASFGAVGVGAVLLGLGLAMLAGASGSTRRKSRGPHWLVDASSADGVIRLYTQILGKGVVLPLEEEHPGYKAVAAKLAERGGKAGFAVEVRVRGKATSSVEWSQTDPSSNTRVEVLVLD